MRNDILAKVSLAGRLGSLITLPFLLIAGSAPAATLPGRLAELPDNERALGESHSNNEPNSAARHAAKMAERENAPETLPMLVAQTGGGSPAASMSAEERARKLGSVAQTLKRTPYAKEGEGPTIYVIAYFTCPHARRFENDWRGKLDNVRMRYVLYGIDDRTMSEAAELALSRDPADFHAFMANAKSAPSIHASDERGDAFNGIVESLKSGIIPALRPTAT